MKMKLFALFVLACIGHAYSQGIKVSRYELKTPPLLGQFHGVPVREGGISGLCCVHGLKHEFFLITDRGPNADASKANSGVETVLFPFPDYAPRILRVRLQGDSLRILEAMALKRPDGATVSGIPHPSGPGNSEVAWVDTNRLLAKRDEWGIDSESLAIDRNGDFWVGDEYGPTIWHVHGKSGQVIERYGLADSSAVAQKVDRVLARRRVNRGFEAIAITPNGKLYAMLQSPLDHPDKAAGDASRLHRIFEIDPVTQSTRMFVYEHEAPSGCLTNSDWSVSDMAAINDHELLVLEHAAADGGNVKKIFKIDLLPATPVIGEDVNGSTLEQLGNAETCVANGILPVHKTLLMDLLANTWDPLHEKPEGLAVVDDTTLAVINDNDFAVDSPEGNGTLVSTGVKTVLYQFTLPAAMALQFVETCQPETARGLEWSDSLQLLKCK